MANLRGLSPLIEHIMQSITDFIKEEDDYFFKKGRQEGKLEGRQEAILRLLKAGVLTTTQLASLFEVSEEFIESLRGQISNH